MVKRLSKVKDTEGNTKKIEFECATSRQYTVTFSKIGGEYSFFEYVPEHNEPLDSCLTDINHKVKILDRKDKEIDLFKTIESSSTYRVEEITEHYFPPERNAKFDEDYIGQVMVKVATPTSHVSEVLFMKDKKEGSFRAKKFINDNNTIDHEKLYIIYKAYNEVEKNYNTHDINVFENFGDNK